MSSLEKSILYCAKIALLVKVSLPDSTFFKVKFSCETKIKTLTLKISLFNKNSGITTFQEI